MTQAHDPKFPQTPSGALYPTHYVVGVIDNLQEARQAVRAFKDAGYDADEIRLMEGQEVLDKAQELDENKNWLQRVLSSFQDTTDETGAHVYLLAAQRGRQILHVRANSEEDVNRISELMMQYHAHTIKYFSPWSVSDVPPQSIPGH
ncbi:MAG TPA: hypothetical protein VHD63_02135 [Ktedonobacteraceae bacterium]|jgi:hypothetical protein|nr:hypothetical protein [Ktedonobacteraceae bacterium]